MKPGEVVMILGKTDDALRSSLPEGEPILGTIIFTELLGKQIMVLVSTGYLWTGAERDVIYEQK